MDRKIDVLIKSGTGFGVVRLNEEGEHILTAEGDDREYKFDRLGMLMNQ